MSITIPLEGFGGGGSALNFKVVAYATEELMAAAKPKENTIGVITDKKITGYHFSATQPENMAEGEVWFSVGASSTVEINALKKNTIKIYPVSAKQYVSGTLVEVVAKNYQNGNWVDWWQGELFMYGNEFAGVTGGWVVTGLEWHKGDDSNPGTLKIEPSEKGGYYLTVDKTHGALWHTANKIDLSKENSIKFVGSLLGGSKSAHTGLGIYSELDQLEGTTEAEITGFKNYGEYSLDVSSLSGSYYIGFRVYGVGKVTVDELCFE